MTSAKRTDEVGNFKRNNFILRMKSYTSSGAARHLLLKEKA